jgi:hypothetical membrane protein
MTAIEESTSTASWQRTLDRLAALGGVIGPVLFAVLVVVGGWLTDGYSHTAQAISELGATGAGYAWLQGIAFVLLGASVVGFAWALARALVPPLWGPLMIGVFGVTVVLAGTVLPCDAGCQGQTTVGLLHNATGIAGFVSAIGGMFLLGRRWTSDPTWASHVGFTRGATFIALVGLLAFIATRALEGDAVAGAAQRLFVVPLLLWVVVTAARLTRVLDRADG